MLPLLLATLLPLLQSLGVEQQLGALQALMVLLLHHVTRGEGLSQSECPMPVHIVLCNKIPREVEERYYRLVGSSVQ